MFTLFGLLYAASLTKMAVSAATLRKRVESPLDPLMSTPSQASVGQAFEIQFHVPNDAFYHYKILVAPPNGPQSSNMEFSNFLLPDMPTERFCIPFSTVTSNSSGSVTPNSPGIWQVAIEATLYYGKNGYEYQANNTSGGDVCVSPPFSRETAFTVPVQVQVVDVSTPLEPASTVVPDPTEVEFNATVTGTPFETTHTFNGSQTTTRLSPGSSSRSWGEATIDQRWTLGAIMGCFGLSLVIL